MARRVKDTSGRVRTALNRLAAVLPMIPGSSTKEGPEWGQSGEFKCPCCEDGTVHWSRAACNGHVWASCSTDGCFWVME